MPLSSNYHDGTLQGGRWFCVCDLEAVWKEPSKGEDVLRCPKPREEQCNFFLAESDEAAARSEKSSDIPPAPGTPVREHVPSPWQTPDSGISHSSADSPWEVYTESLDFSPTPNRFKPNRTEDIASTVLKTLQEDGLVIKSSTEVAIHCIINEKINMYEARLQSLIENRDMAVQKLINLEMTLRK